LRTRRPPRPTLFPYTTLFRSRERLAPHEEAAGGQVADLERPRDLGAVRPAAPELDGDRLPDAEAPPRRPDPAGRVEVEDLGARRDRKSTRLNSVTIRSRMPSS